MPSAATGESAGDLVDVSDHPRCRFRSVPAAPATLAAFESRSEGSRRIVLSGETADVLSPHEVDAPHRPTSDRSVAGDLHRHVVPGEEHRARKAGRIVVPRAPRSLRPRGSHGGSRPTPVPWRVRRSRSPSWPRSPDQPMWRGARCGRRPRHWRPHRKINRRTDIVGSSPNGRAVSRLVTDVVGTHDE